MLTHDELNKMAADSHQNNRQWWYNLQTGERRDRNKGELLMLVITELSEAVEGIRKDLMDDKVPHRKMEEVELADALIRLLDFAGGFGITIPALDEFSGNSISEIKSELSDNKAEALLQVAMIVCCIEGDIMESVASKPDLSVPVGSAIYAIIAYCEKFELDLKGAYLDKTMFNAVRLDHKREARMADGGKKF